MPSIDRPLGGAALRFRLGDAHRQDHIDADLLARSGRTARTLVKEGPLRVTLVALGSGGALAAHRTDGPIMLHVLSGEVSCRAGTDEWGLVSGDLLCLGAGVEHAVESASGGVFLLTVATDPQP